MKEYKIWATVEEIDEEADVYQDISEPECLGTFALKEEAFEKLNELGMNKWAKEFAVTWWQWQDVNERREHFELPKWTQEQCEAFLEKHETKIQDAMADAGWEMLTDLLED